MHEKHNCTAAQSSEIVKKTAHFGFPPPPHANKAKSINSKIKWCGNKVLLALVGFVKIT